MNKPNTASALSQMSVDTHVVSATAMRSATHTRRATASNLPAPNRYPSTICVACDSAMEYRYAIPAIIEQYTFTVTTVVPSTLMNDRMTICAMS